MSNQHLLARSIFQDPSSDRCLRLANEWLQDCKSNHKQCSRSLGHTSLLPTRVIDVGLCQKGNHTKPRLVDGGGRAASFAALSYCWGGENLLTLTAETEPSLRDGIALDLFPQTLRDAIVVARKLQISYLWVDALCIMQDSSEDWAREASRMRDVYRGATLTIAAASASKSSDGIFKRRLNRGPYCRLQWRDDSNAPQTVFLRPGTELTDTTLRLSPINTRGWTLQETLLAPRTLSYGAEQMSFECANGQVDEAGRHTKATENYRSKAFMHELAQDKPYVAVSRLMRTLRIPPVMRIYIPQMAFNDLPAIRTFRSLAMHFLRRHQFFTQGLLRTPGGLNITYYDQWREIVRRYTARQLTMDDDVLPALSGLADEFRHVTGDEYFAGIWKGDMIGSLTWNRSPLRKKRPDGWVEDVLPQTTYLAPSWSWASITGKSTTFCGSQEAVRIVKSAKVLNVRTELATVDPFGKLRNGIIMLRGPFTDIDDPQNPPNPRMRSPEFQRRIRSLLQTQNSPQGHEFRQKHQGYEDQLFGLLEVCTTKEVGAAFPFTEVHFLLLESHPQGAWKRVANFGLKFEPTLPNDGEQSIRLEIEAMPFRQRIVTIL